MEFSYRSQLILYCLHKLNGERTVYGIFHILTGKKSSQTIGDANLYGLSHLFGTLKTIDRNQILESTRELLQLNLIIEILPSTNKFILTPEGIQVLKSSLEAKPIPSKLNGWKYNDATSILWQRLSLLTQVLSNLIHGITQYTAIQQDDHVVEWVKQFVKNVRFNRHELAEMLYKECQLCLTKVPEPEATIFVMRLTGSNRIGYTNDQISSILNEDETWCQLLFINVLHFVIAYVESNKADFLILQQLLRRNEQSDVSLTTSTRFTFSLLLQGKTIDEIANIRNLKRNTIEDHIVEITHNMKDFSIKPFVSKKHQEKILSIYKELNTKQLRPIKERLGTDISYFEIRLVLAKSGV
ncbi:helix-turn-helix domain-containing protein [Fredinandcohnia humi]